MGWSTAEVMQLAIDVEDYSIDAMGELALALGIERSDSSTALLATKAAQLRIKAVIDGLDHLRETVSQLQIYSET